MLNMVMMPLQEKQVWMVMAVLVTLGTMVTGTAMVVHIDQLDYPNTSVIYCKYINGVQCRGMLMLL